MSDYELARTKIYECMSLSEDERDELDILISTNVTIALAIKLKESCTAKFLKRYLQTTISK